MRRRKRLLSNRQSGNPHSEATVDEVATRPIDLGPAAGVVERKNPIEQRGSQLLDYLCSGRTPTGLHVLWREFGDPARDSVR